jgi:hypothetical protein
VGGEVSINGVALLEESEALPTPTTFVAVTVNVYDVLLDSPVIVIGDDEPVAVTVPGLEVTV